MLINLGYRDFDVSANHGASVMQNTIKDAPPTDAGGHLSSSMRAKKLAALFAPANSQPPDRGKLGRFGSAKREAVSPAAMMRAPSQLDQCQIKLDAMVAAFICGDWPTYRDAVDWLRDYLDSEKDRQRTHHAPLEMSRVGDSDNRRVGKYSQEERL